MKIRRGCESDLRFAQQALRAAGLPVDDLTAEMLAFAAESDDGVQGTIGLQAFSRTGLLRSLVVAEAARGQGVGSLLVAALESHCVGIGVEELWLLTIDAKAFFATRGYQERLRAAVPADIRTTREFSVLCPEDAIPMTKRLHATSLPPG